MGAWTTNGKFIVFGGYYKWTAASTQHASEIAYAMNAHDANCDEIITLRAQVAELEKRVSLKGQEVVDVLNNAERYYADFRARIAELEREKGALAEKCEMQERHERHVFASHNSLAKRCRGLEDQVARLAAEVERLQNTT